MRNVPVRLTYPRPAPVRPHASDARRVARGFRPLIPLAIMLLVLIPARATPIRAVSGVTVLTSEASVNFPSGVTFTLEAESATAITDVSLQLNTPTQRYGAYPRNVRPDYQPGSRVSASWTWRRFGGNLPPGTPVTYRWRITDGTGAVTETPLATVRLDDNRFQWRELSDGTVTVRWHQGGDDFGRDLLRDAAATIARLSRDQGVDAQSPVTIHVYASQSELYAALPGVPAWVGGISVGEFDTVLVPIAPGGVAEGRKALAHELTHQLIYQLTFNPTLGSKLPVWLNEGLAVVSEGPTSATNRRRLEQSVTADSVPTLRGLGTSFGSLSGSQAELAYAASESAVRHLLESEGPDKMRSLLTQFRDGVTADEALRRVYGRGVDGTEDGWRSSIGLAPLDRGAGEVALDDSAATVVHSKSSWGLAPTIMIVTGSLIVFTLLGSAFAVLLLVRRHRGGAGL